MLIITSLTPTATKKGRKSGIFHIHQLQLLRETTVVKNFISETSTAITKRKQLLLIVISETSTATNREIVYLFHIYNTNCYH